MILGQLGRVCGLAGVYTFREVSYGIINGMLLCFSKVVVEYG